MFCVYFLQSTRDKSIYVGVTNNLQRRIEEHNKGENTSTKSGKPWELVYCECFRAKEDAIKREKRLKYHRKGISELKKRIQNSLL